MNGIRFTHVWTKARSSYTVLYQLAMLLSLIFGVVGSNFLFEGISGVEAAHMERPGPTLMNPGGSVLLDHALAKSSLSSDHIWRKIQEGNLSRGAKGGGVASPVPLTLSLDEAAHKEVLRRAPMESTKAARQTEVVMSLPMPDGTFTRFRVEESPVMTAELAAQFPDIRTYRGHGLDDPTATTRLDMTPAGFHAIVLSSGGTVIVEPDPHASRDQSGQYRQHRQYISYDQRDAPKNAGSFSCVVLGAEQAAQFQSKQLPRNSNVSFGVTSGATLRTYRLALAATAEFTQTYGGGTVGGALSAMTTMINAVNAIYERDLAIHLMLVANETSIIFTNSATDGYTSDDVPSMASQNQVVLDQRIGSANYDIGMVMDGRAFNFLPGKFIFQGAAQFQSTCNNGQKGKAATVLRSTEPSTISAIWVVAHELAHLLGAMHTFNSSIDDCGFSRFAQVAYEPGSGSTIMGYRGGVVPGGSYVPLCGADDLLSNDTYFHTASIEQITNYSTFGNGRFCPVTTNTGNNPPNIDAGADYTIPANTPFTLMASGSDADGDALTYCWEQFDLGAAGPPHTDNGNRPIFRSFAPVSDPARTFPKLSDILSGTATLGESLPTTDRTMNFRVTVRDNHAGGGWVNTGAMSVNVVSSSGPFIVTQPGVATSWTAGSTQTVTWNVANTSISPINCANVRILLSIDGGNSFPFILAASTPNTGSATIALPNTPTSTARIKVEAIDNIFFNISQPNFTINPNNTSPPMLLTEENTNRAVALDSVTFMREFFPITGIHNFSFDKHTRIALLAVGLELMPGEDISVVTAQAEDAAHITYPLTVEYVGKVPNFNWLTQVNLRLPDGLAGTQDLVISLRLRGAVSNKAVVGIR